MGRILEIFNHERAGEEERPEAPLENAVLPMPSPPSPNQEDEEEMPFIEVGSGGDGIDASADVKALLAKPMPSARPTPILTLHQPHDPAPPKIPQLPPKPKVVFRPVTPLAVALHPKPKEWWHGLQLDEPSHSKDYQAVLESMKAVQDEPSPKANYLISLSADSAYPLVLQLALAAASGGDAEVVVLDAKGPEAGLAEKLGLQEAPGLAEYLRGESSLAEIIRATGYPHLSAITAGLSTGPLRGVPRGSSLNYLLDSLKRRFRWIFLDGGVWEEPAEKLLVAAFCDGVYILLKYDQETAPESKTLEKALIQHGLPLRGSLVWMGK